MGRVTALSCLLKKVMFSTLNLILVSGQGSIIMNSHHYKNTCRTTAHKDRGCCVLQDSPADISLRGAQKYSLPGEKGGQDACINIIFVTHFTEEGQQLICSLSSHGVIKYVKHYEHANQTCTSPLAFFKLALVVQCLSQIVPFQILTRRKMIQR